MANKKVLTPSSGKPTPVRIPPKLQAKIDEGSENLELPSQQVIRLAMDIGLERLKKIDWQIARAIDAAADKVDSGK